MPPSPFPSTDGEPDLEAAARALEGELRRTARFSLVGGRCFEKALVRSPVFERLCGDLQGEGLLSTGDYLVAEYQTVLRPGLMDGGQIVGLVVLPPGRAPYIELTTWFDDGSAVTTNSRQGRLPERGAEMLLINAPSATAAELLAAHREAVARRLAEGRCVAPQVGQGGPLPAVARYLDATGF